MKIFPWILALIYLLLRKGAIGQECSIIILNMGERKTIILMDGAGGEVMWLCTRDPGTVLTASISLKSGSLSPLTPAFSLPFGGIWYNLTVGQANEYVPETAYILVNGEKQTLGDNQIDYVDVRGDHDVAWASCQLHIQCPFSSTTNTPSKSSSCTTSESTTIPHPSPSPMIDPTSVGAVPTLAILLCMALLIILLLSINNCRLMWLLRTKENLSGLSIDPESRICHENCKLLERHHQHGLSQNNEKEKIHPSNSFQAVNTQMTLVAGVSTEDLTSVPDISSRGRVTELSSVPEISPRGREPEESEIPTLESSQKFDNHTTLPFYNPKHGIGNSGYGSTHIH